MTSRFIPGTLLYSILLSAAVSLVGCGDAEVGTVPIKGIVTLDGQPVDAAAVAFIGKGGARIAPAQTDSGGKFTVRASLGKNAVTVAKASEAIVNPSSTEAPMEMPSIEEYKKMPKPKAQIPAKYADPKTSGLQFEIVEGMEEVELSLSTK